MKSWSGERRQYFDLYTFARITHLDSLSDSSNPNPNAKHHQLWACIDPHVGRIPLLQTTLLATTKLLISLPLPN
jgi:hypothetical protein